MKLIKAIYRFFDKKIILPITKLFVSIGKKLKKISKPLETRLNTKSSMIIISLLFSVVMFFVVDSKSAVLLEKDAEVIYNREVRALYNDEEYEVEGLPDKVDITLIGTKANLYLAKQLPVQDITVDLSDLKPGVHKVSLKYKKAVSNVEYKLDPSVATVVISSKKSKTKTIDAEVVNLSSLDSKLSVEKVELKRKEAIIKGSEEELSKVESVKALVNLNKFSKSKVEIGINEINEIPLVAYDENGEIMKVEIVPSTIKAKVEISSPSKSVPVKVNPVGSVVFGKAIESLTPNVQEVTLYGSTSSLEKITSLNVNVDVTGLKSDRQITKTLKKPKGIREISTNSINVNIKLGDEVTTEISGVKLGYTNLNENYTVQATDTSSTEITVILKGVKSVVESVTASSINAYVDLKDLEVGDHKVDVKVKGSDSRISYEPKVTTATIKIAQK